MAEAKGKSEETKEGIKNELKGIDEQNKLSALFQYGHDMKGLEGEGLHMLSKRGRKKNMRRRGNNNARLNRFRQQSDKLRNGQNFNPFAIGMEEFNKAHNAPGIQKVFPLMSTKKESSEHDKSTIPLFMPKLHEESKRA